MVAGVDDDDVLVVVAVVEAEVHMQHDVRPRKKLDGEVPAGGGGCGSS